MTALSGAAFTLVITIRQLTRDRVVQLRELCGSYQTAISASPKSATKTLGSIAHGIFKIGYWIWAFALLAPVGEFAAYSLHSSQKVLDSYSARSAPTPADPIEGAQASPSPTPSLRKSTELDAEWYVDCIKCQVRWLWWTEWLGIVAVICASLSWPIMKAGVYGMKLVSGSIDEDSQIKPGRRPSPRAKKSAAEPPAATPVTNAVATDTVATPVIAPVASPPSAPNATVATTTGPSLN